MNRDGREDEGKKPLKKFKFRQNWDELLEDHHRQDERRDHLLARLQKKHALDDDPLH